MEHSPGGAWLSLCDTFPPLLTLSLVSCLCAGRTFCKSRFPGSHLDPPADFAFLLPNYLRSLPF